MNHNAFPSATGSPQEDTDPFGLAHETPKVGAIDFAETNDKLNNRNRLLSKLGRSIGDVGLRFIGKNKVAAVDPLNPGVVRSSVDKIVTSPKSATKKEYANAATLHGEYSRADTNNAARDRLATEKATLEEMRRNAPNHPQVLSGEATTDRIQAMIDERIATTNAELARHEEVGAAIDGHLQSKSDIVRDRQLDNRLYNPSAAPEKAPETPDDPFGLNTMPEQPVNDDPFGLNK